jgi:hypothetical protein
MWWRIFIPTWRFFDQVTDLPHLEIRVQDAWVKESTPPPPAWWQLLFNPAGGLKHARANLYQRLLLEAAAIEDVSRLISYRLVEDLARDLAGDANHFEFRLVCAGETVLHSTNTKVSV